MRKRRGNMWGKLKIENQMVKEHTHILMGKYMWGNGKVGVLGSEQNTTKTGKPWKVGKWKVSVSNHT
jgi:hypothetical protein